MLRSLTSNTSGQAVVELALLLPLFLLLVFGVIEMSRIGHCYITLSNAVKNGVRVASVGGLDSDIQNTIVSSAPLLDSELLTIEITPGENDRKSGSQVRVEVTYPVSLVTPVINRILPNPVILHSSLSMRLE